MSDLKHVFINGDDQRPEFLFVKSSVDPSRTEYRLNPLERQWIPFGNAEATKLVEANKEWKVSANKKNRNDWPAGTIFKLRGCSVVDNGKSVWVVSNDRVFLEPVEYPDAIEQIEEYHDIIHGTASVTEEAAPVEIVNPTSGYLSNLMKDHPCPTIEDDGFFVDPNIWIQLVRHTDRKKNIMIIGDSGVGKTEICTLLSDSFGKPLTIHDMGATQDPIASLIGVHRFEDGQSKFDQAEFVNDIQKPTNILLDELNRAPLNSNNIMFPLLDRRRMLNMNIASSKLNRRVEVHEDVCFYATANIGNEFTGTNLLDDALKNRFIILKLGYPPSAIESDLLVKRTTVKKRIADKLVRIAISIREKKINGDISGGLSIRQNLEMAELIADGFEMQDALEFYLEPLFEDEYEEIKDILQQL